MLISKEVEVVITNKNSTRYEEKGYKLEKYIGSKGRPVICQNQIITVNIKDLLEGSHNTVDVQCDYCLALFAKIYKDYIKSKQKYAIDKDCCAKCQTLKSEECNLINYGVKHTLTLDSVKNNIRDTIIEKYGEDHIMKVKSIHNKAQQTWLDKSDEEKQLTFERRNTTFEDKYGGHPMATDEIKERIRNTNIEKYGVPYVMQNDEVMAKSRETMYKNGTTSCSRQQRYLHLLFGGLLNYPIDRCSADIAFVEDKIILEFDGNGHTLAVKLGDMSEQDFKTKEIKRYQFLKSKGWKEFRIVSPADYLPSDDILRREFHKALDWFKSDEKGHWHYTIKIGTLMNDPVYGKLRRIKDSDLIGEVG